MSLAASDRWVRYAASAGQTVFDTDFPLLATSDLEVWRERAGVSVKLAAGVDYTPSLIAPNGRVTLAAAALAGDAYVLLGRRAAVRLTDFVSGDLRSGDINADMDAAFAVLQELQRDVARAVAISPADSPTAMTLPTAAERADKLAAFGAAGELVVTSLPQLSGPQPQGAWTSGASYVLTDLVYHGGVVYRCTAGHVASAASEPGVGAGWALVWAIYQQAAIRGRGAWVTATAYLPGDIAERGGASYLCHAAHTSGASTEPGVGGSWATVWQSYGGAAAVASVFGRTGAVAAASGDYLTGQIAYNGVAIGGVSSGTLNDVLVQIAARLNLAGPLAMTLGSAWPAGSRILTLDGSAPLKATYPDVWAYFGTMYGTHADPLKFYLPDVRGEFLRVRDNGRGADPDRLTRTARGDGTGGDAVGTTQLDEMKSHTHPAAIALFNGAGTSTGGSLARAQGASATGATGGAETRGRNIYVTLGVYY